MEDVQALARQLSASPVLQQVKNIWRRASTQFQKELERHARRRGKTDESDYDDRIDTEGRTRRVIKDLVALGKEAGYIEPIKQMLEKLQ
ncbi:uncharacterized protein LOC128199419 [Bicyclus anynana]|uniref:Uncharacterized protein LOC128199419 n=1 Tax=Bicyclus anynana TaxID=110368 RepID=A0ABM3M091_BICAN|nr:uncharacterized protein LOC128199419 [Bicyclus anynana]